MKTHFSAVLGVSAALILAASHTQARSWLIFANATPDTRTEAKPEQILPPAGITLKAVPIGTPRPDSYILVDSLRPSPDSASILYRQRFGSELSLDGIARDDNNLITVEYCTDPAFSPDGKSVAFVYQDRDWMLWHDKKQIEGFEPVSTVHFSPDGKRLYYLARAGRLRFVAEADLDHPKADVVDFDTHVVTPDSTVLAYAARFGPTWRMVINGDPGPAWDRITTSPITAQHGPHVYYVASRHGRYAVCDRHTPGPEFAWIEQPPVLSADGKTFAYWAQGDDQRWHVYKNHMPVQGYDAQRPGELVISDDGKTIATILKRNDAWMVVHNGTPGPAYAAIGANSLTLSPDAERIAYATRRGAGWAVVIDDQEQPAISQLAVNSLKFSPDGKRFAYIALNQGRWTVIEPTPPSPSTTTPTQSPVMAQRASAGVSPSTHPSFNQIETRTLTFSPDSQHLAYLAYNNGRSVVALNGETIGEYEHASHLCFSPDAKHLLYVARENGASQIYVDGQPTGEAFDLLVPGATLHFKTDTQCQTLAIRLNGQAQTTTLWRLELNLDAPMPQQDQDGTPDPANAPGSNPPEPDSPDPVGEPEPSFVDVPTP